MDRIEDLLDRPKAYYNIDGVGEIAGGFMCLGFGLLMWLQAHAPRDSAWHGMPVFIIYVGLMCLILHYGPRAIKKHITYPRTGFVQYRARDARWRPAILAAAVAAAVTVGLGIALRRHWNLTTPAALFGLLAAASYAYAFAKTVRWKWVVACVVALGSVVIAMLPPDLVGALADGSWQGAFILIMVLYGAALLVSGGISFWLYLRHTKAPAQEAQ
jgi:hypothetical protein